MPGQFYCVSLGPVVKDLIVPRALDCLSRSDRIFLMTKEGSRTHKLVAGLVGDKEFVFFMPASLKWGEWGGDPVHERIVEDIYRLTQAGETISLVVFGDASIYSPYGFLSERFRQRGIPCEVVPGLPYFLSSAVATGDYLVNDDGNLLVAGAENIDDLDSAFANAATIVVYAAGREFLEKVQAYARTNALVQADLVKIGGEGEEHEVVDLIADEISMNGGLVVMKRRPQDRVSILDAQSGRPKESDPINVGSIACKEGAYRHVGGHELRFTSFLPKTDALKPALLLFHGGGWQAGDREQFVAHGQTLASLGMAVFTFDYRVKSKHDATPMDSLDDARCAVQWVLDHAEGFAIDPHMIVVGGASAGAHIAIGVSVFERDQHAGVADVPAAYVLFNPVSDTSEKGYGFDYLKSLGVDPESMDLNKHIDRPLPPSIIFHGTLDELVPVQGSYDLARKLEEQGGTCRLHIYPDLPHGFFNHRFYGTNRFYHRTLEAIVDFLAGLDFLPAEASRECRRIHERDRYETTADVIESNRRVVDALAEVDARLSDMQGELQEITAEGGDGAASANKILSNLKAVITRQNKLSLIHKYCSM